MNLYLISQEVNNDYDTYDAAVVCADTPRQARIIHPRGDWLPDETEGIFYSSSWANPKDVKVEFIGKAKHGTKKGVILASFNAG